jgi:hypothetical protein
MTSTDWIVLAFGLALAACADQPPPREAASPPPAARSQASGAVASGGLACRDRATYDRLWPKVASIMATKGHDSLVAFASRYPGCRTLAIDGEPVEGVTLIDAQAVELRLVGDNLPLYAHRLALDTLP